MPLQNIPEDTTSNNRTRSHRYRTTFGAPTNDSSSILTHSTNSTVSNLPGPGRVLGNLYSFAGQHLERRLGNVAQKAGFGPEAVYEKICALHREDWKTDGKKGVDSFMM